MEKTPPTTQTPMQVEANMLTLRGILAHAKQRTPISARRKPTAADHMHNVWQFSRRCVGGWVRRKGPNGARCGFDEKIP